jgi:hypothetical protein
MSNVLAISTPDRDLAHQLDSIVIRSPPQEVAFEMET